MGNHCELQGEVSPDNAVSQQLAVHSCSLMMCSFLNDTRYYWIGCTRLPCDFAITRGLWLLYCAQMGYYIQVTLPLSIACAYAE